MDRLVMESQHGQVRGVRQIAERVGKSKIKVREIVN